MKHDKPVTKIYILHTHAKEIKVLNYKAKYTRPSTGVTIRLKGSKIYTSYRYENNYNLGHDGARENYIIHQIVLSSNLCIAVCVIMGRCGHFRNCICSKSV